MAQTIEKQISDHFDRLLPRDGYAMPDTPEEELGRAQRLEVPRRISAVIPLIDTELSKSLERANAVCSAICNLAPLERGLALREAAEAFKGADDSHRKEMIKVAAEQVSHDFSPATENADAETSYLKMNKMGAAKFLLDVKDHSSPDQRRFIDALSGTNTLKDVFATSSTVISMTYDNLKNAYSKADVEKSMELKTKHWHNLEARAFNERVDARRGHEGR